AEGRECRTKPEERVVEAEEGRQNCRAQEEHAVERARPGRDFTLGPVAARQDVVVPVMAFDDLGRLDELEIGIGIAEVALGDRRYSKVQKYRLDGDPEDEDCQPAPALRCRRIAIHARAIASGRPCATRLCAYQRSCQSMNTRIAQSFFRWFAAPEKCSRFSR